MLNQLLSDANFWKTASATPSQAFSPEDQTAFAVGFANSFKAAGWEAAEFMGFVESIAAHSPLMKTADDKPNTLQAIGNVWNAITDKGNREALTQIAKLKAQHPDMVNAGIRALTAYNEGGVGGLAGEAWKHAPDLLNKGWNYVTSPDVVKQWSPYAMSGLGAMAGAKMLGADNMTAAGAGLVGGYAGGRYFTGQPFMPASMMQPAAPKVDKKVIDPINPTTNNGNVPNKIKETAQAETDLNNAGKNIRTA